MTVQLRNRPTRVTSCAVFSVHCDGSPVTEKHENDGAMGFLSFVDNNPSQQPQSFANPNSLFVAELRRLQALFPDFPIPMMKNLLLREEGRGQLVFQQLMSRGWVPTRRPSKRDRLSSDSIALFDVPYFWGLWRPEYVKVLSKKPAGSFVTGFRSTCRKTDRLGITELEYFVWVVDHKKRVRKWNVQSPILSPSEKNIFSLRYEVPRPPSIPISSLVRLDTM